MKNTFRICALFLCVVPFAALAAFVRPSDVLSLLLAYDGKPRTFSAQAYVNVDDFTMTVTAEGAVEGRTPRDIKGKFAVAADMAEGGAWLATIRMQMLVHGEKLYVLLEDLALREELTAYAPNEYEGVVGQWYAVPIELQDMQQADDWDDVLEQLAEGLQDMGIYATAQDVDQVIRACIDALFSMERTAYQGGSAYSIRLHPNFLWRLQERVVQFLLQHGDEDARSFVEEIRFFLEEMPEMLSEIEEEVHRAVNLHVKVDTNTAHEFVFGKPYLAITLPEENLYIALQGSVQRQMTPVYLAIPRNAITLGEGDTLPNPIVDFLDGFLEGFFQDMPIHMYLCSPDGPCEEDEHDDWLWDEDDDWLWDEPLWPEEPVPLPEVTAPSPRAPRGERCDAVPGTAEYVQLQRKGICPVVQRRPAR